MPRTKVIFNGPCFRCKTCKEFLEGEHKAYRHILFALGLSMTADLFNRFMVQVPQYTRLSNLGSVA